MAKNNKEKNDTHGEILYICHQKILNNSAYDCQC